MILLHITTQSDWEAAEAVGEYAPTSLVTEGFIHLSTPEQVLFPANTFYRGQTGLVLLVVETEWLTAEVRFEDVPGHGTFPHLYGALNREAVTAVVPFVPGEEGTFSLPNLPE